MNRIPRIAISHGDINGIGYEVILKAFEDGRLAELCTPVLFGSAKILNFYKKLLGLNTQYNVIQTPEEARDGVLNAINVVSEDCKIEPGISTETAGEAAYQSLEATVGALKDGTVDALVTAPINKFNIQSENFHFPGHTEFLEAAAGDGYKSLMILNDENIRVALVTTHLPISKIADNITEDLIVDKIAAFNKSLHSDFAIHHPRIGVLSLNPHVGENGLLGSEENDIIIPAINKARQMRIQVFGPYAADGFFGSGQFKKFDGILAMYHDQGLAPFKTIAMDSGVNFTAGLPWVRTSPDHGTGYDIAGQGQADPQSFVSAIYEAIDVWRNRMRDDEAHRHPLKRQYYDKGDKNDKSLRADKNNADSAKSTNQNNEQI